MKPIRQKISLIVLFVLISLSANAELQPIKKESLNPVALKWNKFVDDLVILNDQLIKQTPHYKQTRVGGYSNEPEFFTEIKYFSEQNKTLTSNLQWERKNPKAIHSISVFLRDKQGRITKDFSASYLTKHRNAPIQTLITLHYYNKNLHAFRVFDASHERIYEVCKGTLDGKEIKIDLDDNYGEIAEAMDDKQGIMSSPEYKACFGGRNVDTAQLNIPQI